jgi:hypothetical protein
MGASPCTRIPLFTGVQVVDGLGNEFCSIPGFELSFANAAQIVEYNGAQGTADYPGRAAELYPERAIVRVAWSTSHIYAFVRVYDPQVVPAESVANIWNADGIELYITTNRNVTGSTVNDASAYHFIISPGAGSANGLGATVKTTDYTGVHSPLSDKQFATTQDAEGYTVELRYSLPLGAHLSTGTQVYFDFALSSATDNVSGSNPRDGQAVYYAGQAPSSSPCGTGTVQPYCDDRIWCPTVLK